MQRLRVLLIEFQLILKVYSKDFNCNNELVEELIRENDSNGDGVIDYEEFKGAMLRVKQRVEKQEMEKMDV